MESIFKGKVSANARKQILWKYSKDGDCPFSMNRGFEYSDIDCRTCISAKQCLYETSKRLINILFGSCEKLRNDFIEVPVCEMYDPEELIGGSSDYLTINEDAFESGPLLINEEDPEKREWLTEKRNDIRRLAHSVISNQLEPKKYFHPNTLTYFRNCFPEWNKYEQFLDEIALANSMEHFYNQEKEHSLLWMNHQDDEETQFWDDWKNYSFTELHDIEDYIPENIRKKFIDDYFKHEENQLKNKKLLAKKTGLIKKKRTGKLWPRGWMMKYKPIRNFLETNQGKFFVALWKYMDDNRMKKREGEVLAGKMKNATKKHVLVQVDRKKATEELLQDPELKNISVSEIKIHRCLKWMSDFGLIELVGKPGPRESNVYAIGKWKSYKQDHAEDFGISINYFVHEKNRKKLIEASKVKLQQYI